MNELIKLSNRLLNMKTNLDKMIEEVWNRKEEEHNYENEEEVWTPDVNAIENEDEIRIYAYIPMAKKEDININIKENILSIEGKNEFKTDKKDSILREEIPSGKFSRSFKIDYQIKTEDIKASYKDGILEIKIPKSEASKVNKINIE